MAGLTFLHDGSILIGAPILGGFILDLVLLALPPRRFGRWWVATLGIGLFWAGYFVIVSRTGVVAWSAHLIAGTLNQALLICHRIVAGQIDHRLYAERRKIRIVASLRLRAAIVGRINTAEIVDSNRRNGGRARLRAGKRILGPSWTQR